MRVVQAPRAADRPADYAALDQPDRAAPARAWATACDGRRRPAEDLLDIPAFLRRQAD